MEYEIADNGTVTGVDTVRQTHGWLMRAQAVARRFADRMDELMERAMTRVLVAAGGEEHELSCPCDPATPIEPAPERWDGESFRCETCWQGRVMYLAQSMVDAGARVSAHQGEDGEVRYVISVRDVA